jgi:hypothetical protein
VNQAATPGLGTIWAGRLWMGRGQLAVALVGFCLIVFYIWRMFQNSLRDTLGEPLLPPATAAMNWGGLTFGLAWAWAWFSSISILREAQRRKRMKPPKLHAGSR